LYLDRQYAFNLKRMALKRYNGYMELFKADQNILKRHNSQNFLAVTDALLKIVAGKE